jgi:hypothetical protein
MLDSWSLRKKLQYYELFGVLYAMMGSKRWNRPPMPDGMQVLITLMPDAGEDTDSWTRLFEEWLNQVCKTSEHDVYVGLVKK